MDPAKLLSLASSTFDNVKKLATLREDATTVYQEITTWAGYMGGLQYHFDKGMSNNVADGFLEKKKKSKEEKSEVQEAFDEYFAKVRMQEMEKEIYHMFHYGNLCHLGRDGYNQLMSIREQIRQRNNQVLEQEIAHKYAEEADQQFLNQLKIWVASLTALCGAILEFYQTIASFF